MSTNAIPVDASNVAQLGAWDGDEGAYWADHADSFDRSVAQHHRRLLDAAAIGGTDRVLDIGCGTGQATRDAARAAARGGAVGVDLSARMLDVARRRAADERVANVEFVQADAQVHPFEAQAFDVAISRTGAMFFGDPRAAFENIARAIAPGRRLALVTWQALVGNEWIREISTALSAGRERPMSPPDAPGPFSLSDPSRVRDVLSGAGFVDVGLESSEADMWFGDDADRAHAFVVGLVGWMLDGLDEHRRRRALDDLRATLAAHETPDGVRLGSAAWVITATRP